MSISRKARRASERQARRAGSQLAVFQQPGITPSPGVVRTVPGAAFPALRNYAVNEVAKFLSVLSERLRLMEFTSRRKPDGGGWDDAWMRVSPWGRNVAPWRLLLGIQTQLNFVMVSLYTARDAPYVADTLRLIVFTYRTMREFVTVHIPLLPDEGLTDTDDRRAVLDAIDRLSYAHARVSLLTSRNYGRLDPLCSSDHEPVLVDALCVWFDDRSIGMRPVMSPLLTNREGALELIDVCGWDAFVDYLYATFWLVAPDDLGEEGQEMHTVISADNKCPIMCMTVDGKLLQRYARKRDNTDDPDKQEAA